MEIEQIDVLPPQQNNTKVTEYFCHLVNLLFPVPLIPINSHHHTECSKGKWDPMDGADSEHLELDKDDPLYDEEAADNKYILTTAEDAIPADGEDPTLMDGITDRKVYGPMLTLAEFKLQVAEAVKEYFDASDADEVLRGINELKCREFHPEVCFMLGIVIGIVLHTH